MTNQIKIDKFIVPEDAQIMQKTLKEAHIKQEAPEEARIERETLEKTHVPENCEISLSYVHMGEKWD